MTRVLGFVFGALFAAAGAYLTGPAGGLPFWLFAIGAAGFTLAAVAQYFGIQRRQS